MSKMTMVRVELAPGPKEHAEEIFHHPNLDKEVEFRGGLPFDIAVPESMVKRMLPSFQAEDDPVEEQPESFLRASEDPIIRARGLLKGKKGGTALFMRDKRVHLPPRGRSC